MLGAYELADIEVYLMDEGLDEDQITEFIASHDIASLDDTQAWEIVENHILRDDYDDDLV